jgi:hypothetical protein
MRAKILFLWRVSQIGRANCVTWHDPSPFLRSETMPRGNPPAWRQRKPPFLDAEIQASMRHAEMDEETGKYGTLIYSGCESADRAKEIVRALHRAAMRQGVSVHCEVKKSGRKHDVHFTVFDKQHARRYVVQKYGTDRNAWPYSPRRRGQS